MCKSLDEGSETPGSSLDCSIPLDIQGLWFLYQESMACGQKFLEDPVPTFPGALGLWEDWPSLCLPLRTPKAPVWLTVWQL